MAEGDEIDEDPTNNTISLSREVMEEVIVTSNRSGGGGGGGSVEPLTLLLLAWLIFWQFRRQSAAWRNPESARRFDVRCTARRKAETI
jgi:hypothetical protein